MDEIDYTLSNVLRVFPNEKIPFIVDYAKDNYVFLKNGKKLLDTTAGGTSHAILGWGNKKINQSIIDQLEKFSHADYKMWSDPNVEKLSNLLLSMSSHNLDRVYYSGNSGTEACESAMKMSYQAHYDNGFRNKKWFISRNQSYHGATSDALSLGERPNLKFYDPMLSPYRKKIAMHHPLYLKKVNESLDQYAKRSAKQLEEAILDIGADNVSAFIGETIMGGLVGDVPPAPNYWKYIRNVCDKYNIHLILDEIYCGTGTTGKIYCCDWDGVKPDFILLGKTLAAGYGALSAVITNRKIEEIIKKGQGRLQQTSTHQAHSLSIAAALSVQSIIHNEEFLNNVLAKSKKFKDTLHSELKNHPFYLDLRGRGLRFSLEHKADNNISFSNYLQSTMFDKHSIIINSKWHRTCFSPSLLLTDSQIDFILEKFIDTFKKY